MFLLNIFGESTINTDWNHHYSPTEQRQCWSWSCHFIVECVRSWLKKNLCHCFVSSTTNCLFSLFWLPHVCFVFPLLWNCFCLTFDSFLSDVVVVFSNSSPCHDHGDHSRWPSAPWLNHSPLHLHYSLPPLTVCSPDGEVYVSLSSTDTTSCTFLFGFTVCQIILIWLKLSKYYTKFHILSPRVDVPTWTDHVIQVQENKP